MAFYYVYQFPTTIKRTPNYCSIILSSKWWRLTCLRFFWMTSSTRLRNALKIFTSSTTSPNSDPCWYKNFKTVLIDVLAVLLLIVSNFLPFQLHFCCSPPPDLLILGCLLLDQIFLLHSRERYSFFAWHIVYWVALVPI